MMGKVKVVCLFFVCLFLFHHLLFSLINLMYTKTQVDQFLESLINFDKENIADPTLKAITPYLSNKEFDPNFIRNKSIAAAGEFK